MVYRKMWFAKGTERTAGLIITGDWVEKNKANLVSEASRLFPMYEAPKMHTFHISPPFRGGR